MSNTKTELTELKKKLSQSDNGDTFTHGRVYDEILNVLIDAEIERQPHVLKDVP